MIIRYQKKFTKLGIVGTVSDPPQLSKIDMATSENFENLANINAMQPVVLPIPGRPENLDL